VISVLELLTRSPEPSRVEVSQWLGGHLCRCTGYVKILEAVDEAARILREERA
jgi:aerobic-type carbon monoxide dehydrogenase small subunit (CoxS/CutS family)